MWWYMLGWAYGRERERTLTRGRLGLRREGGGIEGEDGWAPSGGRGGGEWGEGERGREMETGGVFIIGAYSSNQPGCEIHIPGTSFAVRDLDERKVFALTVKERGGVVYGEQRGTERRH